MDDIFKLCMSINMKKKTVSMETTNVETRPFFFISWFTGPPTQIFCILEKNKNFTFYFFYFLRCKKLPDLKKKKKKILKKNNKNCLILHCKNAEMTILLSFLHFNSVKSYNFCYFFFI